MNHPPPSMLLRTTTPDDTRKVARRLAALAQPGDVLLLAGDLGAGKTTFTQGFGAGLGVDDQIVSPTFTIARAYEGRLRLHHLDAYRLERLGEIADTDLAELLDEGSVVVIEWGDAVTPVLPAEYLEVRIELGEDDDERRLELLPVGERWGARGVEIGRCLAGWAVLGGGEEMPPC